MSVPTDYLERVYAGVLGKLIGVYLGRPFEGWTYQRIMKELGSIEYYVHDRLKVPLVVTDDDVSGTFTFVRALEEHGVSAAAERPRANPLKCMPRAGPAPLSPCSTQSRSGWMASRSAMKPCTLPGRVKWNCAPFLGGDSVGKPASCRPRLVRS